jgi:hypothetical protein
MPEKLALQITEEAIRYHESVKDKLLEIINKKETANDPCPDAPAQRDTRQL